MTRRGKPGGFIEKMRLEKVTCLIDNGEFEKKAKEIPVVLPKFEDPLDAEAYMLQRIKDREDRIKQTTKQIFFT